MPRGTGRDFSREVYGSAKGLHDADKRTSDAKKATPKGKRYTGGKPPTRQEAAGTDGATRALAKSARDRAAEVAMEQARKRVLAKATARGAVINARLEKQLEANATERAARLARLEQLEQLKKTAVENDNVQLAADLSKQISVENVRLLDVEKREMQQYGYRERAEGFDRLAGKVAVRNASSTTSGAALGDPDSLLRAQTPRERYGGGNPVRDQFEFDYKTTPG